MSIKYPLLFSLILASLFITSSASAKETWSLAKQAEGIKVYLRTIPNSPLSEFKGEIEINTSAEKLVRVLRDADAFRRWMPGLAASKLLKITDTEQYHYLVNESPWPVSNRDGIYHFTYTTADDSDIIVIQVEAIPDYLPRRSENVRIPQANGQWTLAPTATGVQVTYQMHASPGGSIPDWLANQAVVDTPYDTLNSLRSYVQHLQ